MKIRLSNFTPFIVAVPSITIGAIAMYHNKIPTLVWAQNIACLVIAGLISYFVVSKRTTTRTRGSWRISIPMSLLFIVLTFINPGMDGVHRWLSIGLIKFNVSMIVLPILIIELWQLSQFKSLWLTIIITFAISVFLAIQPDASQLTGFAIPMMIILCNKTNKRVHRLFIILILTILIILSWVFLDSLPPVAYVEGILSLLANMGLIWLTLGVLSLLILPVPFILFPPKGLKLPSISIGLYFIIIIISTFLGNFPVPLIGYGISPIIGYFAAITWHTKARIN